MTRLPQWSRRYLKRRHIPYWGSNPALQPLDVTYREEDTYHMFATVE